MTALQEAERLMLKLTRAEKALLAQRLVSDWGDAKSLDHANENGIV